MRLDSGIKNVKKPDKISSYFRLEILTLTLVTISGIIYNVGMTAAPYFEGKLAQCLFDIGKGYKTTSDMVYLASTYLAVILFIQIMRSVKRFFVRRFANNISRDMRHMLYNSLVHMDRKVIKSQDIGTVMTKAVSDVDACVEGMRKFTTEVFDTGVVLISYTTMLFIYDWRLTLISCALTPIAYFIAVMLKTPVTKSNAEYKKSAERLGSATMDRVSNALTYRSYGCETQRSDAYEVHLKDYEKCAVRANLWENTMRPIYNIISMSGVVFIIYFGAKNVMQTGWTSWDIGAFATFLSCFGRMATKASKAAKLFNSVQKAQVSWVRIRPLMKPYVEENKKSKTDFSKPAKLNAENITIKWPDGPVILKNISFSASAGEIIGVTGPVACGKSALGKVFIGETPYTGSVSINEIKLSSLSEYEKAMLISYMGHEPELISDTIEENIRLGESFDVKDAVKRVCLNLDIENMPNGVKTAVGNGGIQLSGGQQSRTALARTLFNSKSILILDDPFSAVDRSTEETIINNIREISKDKIILIFSHRLYLFPSFDKILFLDGGKGIFGKHDKVIAESPKYRALYAAQSGGKSNERK